MMMKSKVIAAVLLVTCLILGGATLGTSEEAGISEEKAASSVRTKLVSFSGADALPNAKPGECYSKVLIPAEYNSETEQIVKRDAYEKIEIIPAKYQMVDEQVIVKEGTEKFIPVDPVFETLKQRVEVQAARRVWRQGRSSKSKRADSSLVAGALSLGLPASAEVGQCFEETYQPAENKTETEQVVKRDAYEGVEVIPAKYEMVEEKILVKDASIKLVEVPPVYETVTEKVLEAPAYTTWKTGRGPVERLNNSTGDIMCLVEVPAKYKTVKKQVLKSPATTQKIEIPAEYKVQKVKKLVSPALVKKIQTPAEHETVTKKIMVSEAKTLWQLAGQKGLGKATGRIICLQEIPAKYEVISKKVLKAPATTKKVEIPAEFKVQKVRKLVAPAQVKRIQVPAEVDTFTRRVKVSDDSLEWRPVLCETNMSKDLNTQIQQSLKARGYNPGTIDGVIGQQTMVAIGQFQKKEGLPRGGVTLRTLSALGINPSQ
jgi:hypothetical protein